MLITVIFLSLKSFLGTDSLVPLWWLLMLCCSGAIKKLSMFKNIEKRPMAWPCQLTIGSAVSIRIVGYKAVSTARARHSFCSGLYILNGR